MLKKNIAATDVKDLNLLTLAGLAVKSDGTLDTLTINTDNLLEQIPLNDSSKNSTIINSVHIGSKGFLFKIQGRITREVKWVINDLVKLMKKQGLVEAPFPGFTSSSNIDIFIGDSKQESTQIPAMVVNATLYDNLVLFLKKSDPNTLFSVPLSTMRSERNWIIKSAPLCSFRAAINSLGRVSAKNQTLVVNLASRKAMLYNFKSAELKTLFMDTIGNYLGNFKLSDNIDHSINIFTNNLKMFLIPAQATPK